MIDKVTNVTLDTIVNEVMKMKNEGYRFVTMSTSMLDENTVDVLYHFDKDLELVHLRMQAELGKPVPSVSGVYFAALLAENELQDILDLKFEGLVLDFNRTLLIDEEITTVPLTNNVKVVEKR